MTFICHCIYELAEHTYFKIFVCVCFGVFHMDSCVIWLWCKIRTVLFLFCTSYISFPWHIALARMSTTMLNKCGDSGHAVLVLYVTDKDISFSPLILFTGGLFVGFFLFFFFNQIEQVLYFCFLWILRWVDIKYFKYTFSAINHNHVVFLLLLAY